MLRNAALLLVAPACVLATPPSSATNLRVEYMTYAVVDSATPRFFWVPQHADRGQGQTAYRIQVNLTSGAGGVVWDSGQVTSNSTTHIPYGGSALTSDSAYAWSVTWWDRNGAQAPWATPGFFTVGLLTQAEWTSDWITCPVAAGNYNQLRTEFSLNLAAGVTVTEARLYITGMGYYRAYINGFRVGATELDPAWTTYPQRVLYSTYDVTGMLSSTGNNVIAAYVGNGWPNIAPNPFNGSSSANAALARISGAEWADLRISGDMSASALAARGKHVRGSVAVGASGTGAVRKLRAQLHVHTSDGATQVIVTSAANFDGDDAFGLGNSVGAVRKTQVRAQPAWLCGTGALQYDDVYNGCTWDARAETLGWDLPGYNVSGWLPAARAADPGGNLGPTTMQSQNYPAVEVVAVLPAQSVQSPAPGVYVFDFEQNFSGYCRLILPAPVADGVTITLRHAEVLQHPPYGPQDGNIYVGNLRSAKATDTYVTRATTTGALVLEPMFTYHGFRYVEVTGLPFEPTLDMLQGLHFRSAVAQTGNVVFPDTANVLNQLQHAIVWGQGSNLMSLHSDCPQRDERKGWMGDSALTQEEGQLNYDMCAMDTFWAQQMQDAQVATQYSHPTGTVPDTVPWTFGGDPGDFAWQTAYPTVVYTLWKFCGDADVAAKHYNNIKALIDYEADQVNRTGMARTPTSYGDWCPPPAQQGGGQGPKPSGSFISASALLGDMQHFLELATALGNTADVAAYGAELATFTQQYNSAFFNAANNNYGNANGDGLQTANGAALGLGIVPAGSANAVAQALDTDLVTTHSGHWSTGIFGMKFLHRQLTAYGYGADAVSNLLTTDYPGFGYWFNNDLEPATTMNELPDMAAEGPGMNSRNHIMFGAVGAYVFDLAGIRQMPDSVGWSHVALAPAVTGHPSLPFATGSVRTVAGDISISWANVTAQQCINAAQENTNVTLTCTGGNSTITSIDFASFGTASGDCSTGFAPGSCSAANSSAAVAALCVGKASCVIPVSDDYFGDPCFGTLKWLDVVATCSGGGGATLMASVPVNTRATAWIPFPAGAAVASLVVTEGQAAAPVFRNGGYVAGVAGVTNAYVVNDPFVNAVAVEIGSGSYAFTLGA